MDFELLLVEDDPGDAELTLRALAECNYNDKTIVLKDGEEAINFIFKQGEYTNRTGPDLPKLILLDLNLPKIHGLKVIRQLKSDDRTKDIPIIILTSSSDDIIVKECFKLGVSNYVLKNIDYANYALSITARILFWLPKK